MGQVEHRALLAEILSAEPPTIPEEVSYVEAALAHPERVRYFAEKARFDDADRSRRWFAWLEARPAFLALFSQAPAREPTARALMGWIADQCILSEGVSGSALRAFRDRPWPSDTWCAIAQALCFLTGTFPKWLNPWLLLVLQNAPTHQHDLLDMLLVVHQLRSSPHGVRGSDPTIPESSIRPRSPLGPTSVRGDPSR